MDRSAGTRLIAGNLHAESEMAGLPDPPLRVLRRIAALATLLRAFAREGDALWVPAPIDPHCMVAAPGLPLPHLISGPFPADVRAALCFASTASTARLPGAEPGPIDGPVHEALWRVPRADPDAVRAVHHRAFGLQVARSIGEALPGSAQVCSAAEVVAAAAAADREVSSRGVLKAPLSASGRARVVFDLDRAGAPEVKARVEHLLDAHGELLFEPWCDRVADFGACALAAGEGVRLLSVHRQIVDPRDGRFLGAALGADRQRPDDLAEGERARLLRVVQHVGAALIARGYQGPFGVDAFRWRRADGSLAFHPACEVNARMTFGLVLLALAERMGHTAAGPVVLELRGNPGGVPILRPAGDAGPDAPAATLHLPEPQNAL